MTSDDKCRPVEVDGQIIRVRGAREMTPEEVDALAVIVRVRGAREMTPEEVDALAVIVRTAKHLLSLPVCPECHAGKHRICIDQTWCVEHDDFAPCPCAKHGHKAAP